MAGYQTTLKRKLNLTPDVRQALNKTHARTSVIFRRAARAFVEAVADEVAKHQDTGMSYASLFHIAKIVRANLPPSSPVIDRRKGFTSITGSYYSERYRSRRVGEQLGEKAGRIQYGSPTNPRYNFVFEIKVYQYLIHEYGFQRPGLAWDSINKGVIAMQDYIFKHARFMYPELSDLFRETGFGVREPFVDVE